MYTVILHIIIQISVRKNLYLESPTPIYQSLIAFEEKRVQNDAEICVQTAKLRIDKLDR